MSFSKKRRFWTDVTTETTEDGVVVRLDGRLVKTPAKATLALPTQAAADLVAAEWAAQGDEVKPETMPATRWANLSIDKMRAASDEVVDMLAEYGSTDLLCYRAVYPDELTLRQEQAWDGPLAWAAQALDAPLNVTRGVVPVEQPNQSVANMRAELSDFDPFSLAAVHDLVVISGSLVLGLAVAKQKMSVEEAWDAARVDENWQIEQWGVDEEAAQAAERKLENFRFAEKLLNSVTKNL